MPSGMDGAMRAGTAAQGSGQFGPEQYRFRDGKSGPPQFFLGDREVAIVRLLATGAEGDPNLGVSQVFVNSFEGRDWRPAPGAYDDEEGKYRGKIPDGWKLAARFGIHMYVLAHYHMNRPTGDDGNVREYAASWKQVMLPDMLRTWVRQVDGMGVDPETGVRWLGENPGYRIWFRGVGFNNAVLNELNLLQSYMKNGNLSSANIIIARKPSPPGKPIPQPEYFIKQIPEGLTGFNDPLTDAQKADIMRYHKALPPIKEYFEARMKWPLFDDSTQASPVPTGFPAPEAFPAAMSVPGDTMEFMERPTPRDTPPPPVPPVPVQFVGAGEMEEFRLT